MINVFAEELKALASGIFQRRGMHERDSAILADSLVHANLRGLDSHGAMRIPHYVRRLELGSIVARPVATMTRTGPATAMIDGGNGFAHVTNWDGMDLAISMARETGAAFVGVQHSNHCGALSFFVTRAVESGMIGMAFSQADKGVVPIGGMEPFAGSNPLCIGAPSASGQPVMVDMATSTVAGGHIFKARAENKPIPDTWAVDREGRPTTDPHRAAYWTPAAGAKGYGLGVMMDLLTGVLCGGDFGPHILPMYDQIEKTRNLCHLLGVIDISRFAGGSAFPAMAAAMIREIHEVTPAPGVERVLAPGEPEYLKSGERARNGIPMEETLWNELCRLAEPTVSSAT